MFPALQRLSDHQDMVNQKADADRKHSELLAVSQSGHQDVVKAIHTLINYLHNRTDKTEVVNHPESISTPDVDKVVTELGELHQTLKTHENTDLSPVTAVLAEVLQELKSLPKEYQKVEIPDSVTIANQTDNSDELKAILKAVKDIKLDVKAPIVNVPKQETPQVKVDAPDLSPLSKDVGEVTKAVKAIKFPESMETRQTNTLITEPFDEYRLKYEQFAADEDDPPVEAIEYYNKGKKVATIEYSYSNGRLSGAKRT